MYDDINANVRLCPLLPMIVLLALDCATCACALVVRLPGLTATKQSDSE